MAPLRRYAALVDDEQYVYDGSQVVLTIDRDLSGSAPTTGYMHNRYLYAPRVDELLADENFGGRGETGVNQYDLLWAATDHLGSVRQLVNDVEEIFEHREYDSFGQITALYDDDGTTKNLDAIDSVFGFAGREWDNEAGLSYNRARWLDPRIGRFLSEDPIGFGFGKRDILLFLEGARLTC